MGRDSRELEPFAPVLECLLEAYGDADRLAERVERVVELGPGRRVGLARSLTQRLGDRRFECIGLPEFSTDLGSYRFADLAEWAATVPRKSLDLVLSRHALEENSYHPIALLRSKELRRLVLKGRRDGVLEAIPGTRPYLLRLAPLLARGLRPGAHLVLQVLDRPRADAFLAALEAEGLRILRRDRTRGRSGIVHARYDGRRSEGDVNPGGRKPRDAR